MEDVAPAVCAWFAWPATNYISRKPRCSLQASARFTLWVRRTDVSNADDVPFTDVNPQERVHDFKWRVLSAYGLSNLVSLSCLQHVRCAPGAEPTPAELAAAKQLSTRTTIIQSGVRDEDLLLLAFLAKKTVASAPISLPLTGG